MIMAVLLLRLSPILSTPPKPSTPDHSLFFSSTSRLKIGGLPSCVIDGSTAPPNERTRRTHSGLEIQKRAFTWTYLHCMLIHKGVRIISPPRPSLKNALIRVFIIPPLIVTPNKSFSKQLELRKGVTKKQVMHTGSCGKETF